jgi:3-oxocholest-4-en-26-oate---CoA ligase
VVKPINTGGEYVFPDEVEAVLKYHPRVADAVVVGVKDRQLGERLVALVQPAPGEATPSLAELTEHCRARLVGYRVPRVILTVESVVRLDSGKPDYDWARGVAAEAEAAAAR